MLSHAVWSPMQVPAFPKAWLNFAITFDSQAERPEESPLAATFA
jgi:hypothetical protein